MFVPDSYTFISLSLSLSCPPPTASQLAAFRVWPVPVTSLICQWSTWLMAFPPTEQATRSLQSMSFVFTQLLASGHCAHMFGVSVLAITQPHCCMEPPRSVTQRHPEPPSTPTPQRPVTTNALCQPNEQEATVVRDELCVQCSEVAVQLWRCLCTLTVPCRGSGFIIVFYVSLLLFHFGVSSRRAHTHTHPL